MDFTPKLNLPYLLPNQAQKHVTINESLELVDVLIQTSVESLTASDPPSSPSVGEAYIVAPNPSDEWAGHTACLAIWQSGKWGLVTPNEGWVVWDKETLGLYVYQTEAWKPLLQRTPNIGISTVADDENRLAVAAPSSLFTHDGSDHRLKINKATWAATSSVIFQSDYSGLAEMGLLGNNDFSIKVSNDGSSWLSAMIIDATSGFVGVGGWPGSSTLTLTNSASGESPNLLLRNYQGSGCSIQSERGLVLSADSDDNSGAQESYISLRVDGEECLFLSSEGRVHLGRNDGQSITKIKGHLSLEPSLEPNAPQAGTIYFDDSISKLRCYDGSAWRDLF